MPCWEVVAGCSAASCGDSVFWEVCGGSGCIKLRKRVVSVRDRLSSEMLLSRVVMCFARGVGRDGLVDAFSREVLEIPSLCQDHRDDAQRAPVSPPPR